MSEAEKLFNEGVKLAKSGHFEEAITACDQAIALDPKFAAPWNVKAVVLHYLGHDEEALKTFDQVIILDPESAIPWNEKGNILNDIGHYEEALKAFDQAIKLDPGLTTPWIGKGNILKNLCHYEKALKAYNQAIILGSKFIHLWYDKGIVSQNLGLYEEALKAFEQVIVLDPNLSAPWNGKGNALSELGFHEDALHAFNQAIVLDPKDAYPWNGKGNALSDLGRHEEALHAFSQAISLDPKLADLWYGKGNALFDLVRYEEALHAFSQAISLNPNYAMPWNGKGLVYYRMNNYDETIRAYDRAIAIDPKYADPWYGKGLVYFVLKDARNANCFARFIYLAKETKLHNTRIMNTLLSKLHVLEMPLLIERVFKKFSQLKGFLILQHFWLEIQQQLNNWKQLQKFRQIKDNDKDWEGMLFEAVGKYYLGDIIQTFQIFDKKLFELVHYSLIIQYYFGKAASSFFEREDQIWRFAENNALKFEPKNASEWVEGYYAGLILIIRGKLNKAQTLLEKQQDHLPSLYALTAIAKEQNENLKPYAEKILQREARLSPHDQLINGFIPRPWNIQEGNFLEQLQQYCYIRELAEIITEIRDYAEESDNYQHLIAEYHSQPFHESFYIDAPGEKYIWDTIKTKLAEEAHEKLIQSIRNSLEEQRSKVDQTHLNEVLQNSPVKKDFEALKQKATESDLENFDEEVGVFIENHPDFKPTVYIYLLQYFYYSDALDAENAVYLYFYLALIKKKEGWSSNAIIDFLGSLVKDIINVSLGGGLFVSGLTSGLLTLLTRYIKENTETDTLLCDPETTKYSKKEWDEVLSDYYKFKHCFLQYLMDLRYEMGPQKFEELYSKEASEWVKGMK